MLYNYRQKAPSRIARLFHTKNGQPANSKPKPRESALKPPGTLETWTTSRQYYLVSNPIVQ
jgi:hypothetical protein